MIRSKKYVTVLVSLIVALALLQMPIYAENSTDNSQSTTDLGLNCKSAILMEAETGKILYEQNSNEALPPASVTKIMTLLLVMEAIDSGSAKWDDTITASAHASSMGGSQIYLKEGEQMSLEDMVKSVVISSANDAAVALAEHIAGSEEAFVSKMNARAAELSMSNTHFENTNGLDDTAQNHVTSAKDIAIMSRELIKHKKILDYSSLWMDTIRNGAFGLTNTNRLVRFYNGCTGLKTGSTSKAKFCISATAERNGMSLIAVIMASPTRDERNAAAKKLLDWGYANYELYRSEISLPENINVVGGMSELCRIDGGALTAVVPKGSASKIKAELTMPDSVTAPIEQGSCVGHVKYTLNGNTVGENEVVAAQSVGKINYWVMLQKIISYFLLKY